MNDLPSGTIVGERYRIIATLGRGGHGTVYKAFDISAQRTVALKILSQHPSSHDDLRRSLSETVLARLEHPNILRVLEHGDADGHLYLATQFVEGRSLDQILRERERLEADYAIEIVVRVGTALSFAHWQGVIHRDVKPSNVMVSTDGNVLLADFALAAQSGESTLTSGGTVFGTPAYMSPEQAMGDSLDARSDVFSLGAVFYEALTGRKWFSPAGESVPPAEIMRRVVETRPRPLRDLVPDLPDAIAVVVHQALANDPSERYQSAVEFVTALLPTKAVPLGILAGMRAEGSSRERTGKFNVPLSAPITGFRRLLAMVSQRWQRPRSGANAQGRAVVLEGTAPVDDEHATVEVPAYLPQSERRVWEFASLWDDLAHAAHESQERFAALTETLVRGPLREAIGYRLGDQIPYFRGTFGYMVEAPFLWIRQSRFPLLFVASDSGQSDLLSIVAQQVEVSRATEYFALLVVVPPPGAATGREAEELRRVVADSVYRLDFVVLDRDSLASIVAHNNSNRLIEICLEQVDNLTVFSPYIVRGPVPGRMFFGREREIKTISQRIPRGDYAVVGGRRIGKSSILLRLKRVLGDDPRYHALYIDCEAHFTDDDFFASVREQLDRPADGDPYSFRQMAIRLRETNSPRQVVFLLDEIDELLAFDAERHPAGQLFKALRAASQEGICRFVFSGSRTLHGHLRDSRSPFFNFCEAIALGRLDEQSVSEIVRKPMHQLGMDIPEEEEVIRRLIELTSSHPNVAQWVCDRLLRSSVQRRITLEALEWIATTDEFHEQYVSTAWGDATPLEKLISLVMNGPSFYWDQVLQALAGHGLYDQKAIREALNFLQLCSLLEHDSSRYRFGLAEFPRIVRESGIVPTQIESLASEARSQCS